MNKNIKRLKVFPTLLLSGVVALSLSTCTKKEGHEIIPPTMEESFYDNNDEGIDDLYESLVDNSDFYISRMNRIEKLINLLDRIQVLNRNITFDKDNKYLDYYDYIENPDKTDIDPLDEIEKRVSFYEENIGRMNEGKKEIFNEVLVEDYHKLVSYLLYGGSQHMENILLDLAKVVGASSINLDNLDNIEVYIDEHNLTLTGNGYGWYTYSDNGEFKKVIFSDDNSNIYDLVDNYLDFHNNGDNYSELYDDTQGIEQLKDKYSKALSLIKKTVHNTYELKDGLFDSEQIIKIKK